jgi:capsular exopolysaccharide synthesis family protein
MPDRFSITRPGRDLASADFAGPIASFSPPQGEGYDEGPDWRRAFAAIRRHLTLVIAIIAVGSAAAVFVARRLSPQYRVVARIWIASQNEVQGRGAQLGPIRQDQLLQWESWVDLLRSYAILDPVVRDLRLNVMPVSPDDSSLFRDFQVASEVRSGSYSLDIDADGSWRLAAGRRGQIDQGARGDSIGRALGFRWALAPDSSVVSRRVKFNVVSLRAASEELSRALEGRVDRNGAWLLIELTGPSATQAAVVVNAVASRYVEVASDLKRRRLAEFARNLEDQRTEAQENLERVERDLEQFRIRNAGLPRGDEATGRAAIPGGASPVVADAGDLDRVKRDRRTIAHWIAASAASRPPGGPLLLTTTSLSPDLQNAVDELTRKRADLRTLRYRYEDVYPAVQLLNEDINLLTQQTLPSIVRQLDAELASRERELTIRLAAHTDTLRAIPTRLLEEARLVRATTLASTLYSTVQQRYQEAQLAQASSLPDVSVLDSAVPGELPVSDQSLRVLLFGVGASIALAIVLAVGLDRMDPRVRYPAEVSRRMGLAILGAVPHLRARRGNAAITPEAAEEVTEALRAVRVALTHTGSVTRPLVLTVSSSGPGDGKSFITSNLGLSFALAGYRTLVIDGDVRRGTLHRAFGAQRRPGLTDCLRGEAGVHEILQRTPFDSLTVIGSGTRTRVAPELLGGPAMTALFDTLRTDYDVILCDSPPLSAGVDPYVLGTLTGQMLLVLRTGVSVRSVLEAKLAVLSQLPVRLLGAVLNAVPAGELYRPYSYYVQGYAATDEVEPTPSLPAV